MASKKSHIDKRIKEANIDKGICVLLTGNGKGKTSSALGMVCRALGYGMNIAVVQFIKGVQETGETLFFKNQLTIKHFSMKTGFTWDTQDKAADTKAALETWAHAKQLLNDETIDLLVLDELTYMLSYGYLDKNIIIKAITNRPKQQHLVITGRGADAKLIGLADTVSEIKDVKHAFRDNIKAQKGVDY